MNIYIIFGLAIILLIILYFIHITFFKSKVSFNSIDDIQFFGNKPNNGKLYYKGDLLGFGRNIYNGMSIGYVLYLTSPENNVNHRRNIFAIYDSQINKPNDECIENIDNYNLPTRVQSINGNNTPGIFASSYLDKNGSTLQVGFQLVDGTIEYAVVDNIPYNKINVINYNIGDKYIEIYIDGKLAITKQFRKQIDYNILQQTNTNIVSGYCEGFNGYLYNLVLWNKKLDMNQLSKYVASSKIGYKNIVQTTNAYGLEIIPCSSS